MLNCRSVVHPSDLVSFFVLSVSLVSPLSPCDALSPTQRRHGTLQTTRAAQPDQGDEDHSVHYDDTLYDDTLYDENPVEFQVAASVIVQATRRVVLQHASRSPSIMSNF